MSHARRTVGLVVVPVCAARIKVGWTVRRFDRPYKVRRVKKVDGGLLRISLVDGPPIRCVPEYEVDVETHPTEPVCRESGQS